MEVKLLVDGKGLLEGNLLMMELPVEDKILMEGKWSERTELMAKGNMLVETEEKVETELSVENY